MGKDHLIFRTDHAAIHVGDCRLLARAVTAKAGRFPNLIFADPPFGQGDDYAGFKDYWPSFHHYLRWTEEWIDACLEGLAAFGSIWINAPARIASYIQVFLELRGLHFRREVIWYYRFGQCIDSNFISAHTRLLYFTRSAQTFTWHPDAVLEKSDRLAKYRDKRTAASARAGWRVPLDVWEFPRIQGNNRERRPGHPNQVPEAILARIINACSHPGDLVMDPFAGSGTTPTVAVALGREALAIEISRQSAESAYRRVQDGPARKHIMHGGTHERAPARATRAVLKPQRRSATGIPPGVRQRTRPGQDAQAHCGGVICADP